MGACNTAPQEDETGESPVQGHLGNLVRLSQNKMKKVFSANPFIFILALHEDSVEKSLLKIPTLYQTSRVKILGVDKTRGTLGMLM